MRVFIITLLALFGAVLLLGCGPSEIVGEERTQAPLEPLGNFSLGYNVVVTEHTQIGPFSRTVELDLWELVLSQQIDKRLGQRYEGEKLYHLGVGIDTYALAAPGIPLVFSPKSVLALSVTLWDDAAQEKLNKEPKKIIVFEKGSLETAAVGSGNAHTVDEQVLMLSERAAEAIEKWLAKNKAWFEDEETTGETEKTNSEAG